MSFFIFFDIMVFGGFMGLFSNLKNLFKKDKEEIEKLNEEEKIELEEK